MHQFTIANGTRQVVVTSQQAGRYTATYYVNSGATITRQRWTGKTERGARKWATRILGVTAEDHPLLRIAPTTTTPRQPALGDRVYTQGDMANHPKDGTITGMDAQQVLIEWDAEPPCPFDHAHDEDCVPTVSAPSWVYQTMLDNTRWGWIDDRTRRYNEAMADLRRRLGKDA
jgi:hypothetical protein